MPQKSKKHLGFKRSDARAALQKALDELNILGYIPEQTNREVQKKMARVTMAPGRV